MTQPQSLLALVESMKSVETLLIESGGEITPEIQALLALTDFALPEKVDNYSLMIDRFNSLEQFYKEKAEFVLRMARAFSDAQDRMKTTLKLAMQEMKTDEIKGFDIRFKLSATKPSVVIDDTAAIDAAYTTTEQVVKINKDRIRQDLDLGVPVKGARLEKSFSLRNYANSPAAQKKVAKV